MTETQVAQRIELPAWMIPGTKFTDEDGARNIYLGEGGIRVVEQVKLTSKDGEMTRHEWALKFKPSAPVYVYRYKGEWHLAQITTDDEGPDEVAQWLAEVREGWKEDPSNLIDTTVEMDTDGTESAYAYFKRPPGEDDLEQAWVDIVRNCAVPIERIDPFGAPNELSISVCRARWKLGEIQRD